MIWGITYSLVGLVVWVVATALIARAACFEHTGVKWDDWVMGLWLGLLAGSMWPLTLLMGFVYLAARWLDEVLQEAREERRTREQTKS